MADMKFKNEYYVLSKDDLGHIINLDLLLYGENSVKKFLLIELDNDGFYALDLENKHTTKHHGKIIIKNDEFFIDSNPHWYQYEDLVENIYVEYFSKKQSNTKKIDYLVTENMIGEFLYFYNHQTNVKTLFLIVNKIGGLVYVVNLTSQLKYCIHESYISFYIDDNHEYCINNNPICNLSAIFGE